MEVGLSPICGESGSNYTDQGKESKHDIDETFNMTISTGSVDGKGNDTPSAVWSEQFRLITRRMSRAILYCREPRVQTDKRVMYRVLYELFAQWSERQQRAHYISLTVEQVKGILQYGERTLRQTSLVGSTFDGAQVATDLIMASPLLPIDVLARELRSLQTPVVLTPVAEVLEVARLLDAAQGLCTPLGAVNLLHFIALCPTLCPVADMQGLLLLVASNVGGHHLLCAAIYHEWAVIDKENQEELLLLSRALEEKHQQGCDEATEIVVTALLKESFGSLPTDPVTADRPQRENLQGAAAATEGKAGRHLDCDNKLPPPNVNNTNHHDDVGEECRRESSAEVELGSECSEAVDAEFWRRLCS